MDSGHEDDMEEDKNHEEFPDVCLFSVAMMIMEKVRISKDSFPLMPPS